MGDLSIGTVVPNFPFNCAGVDFFGPFFIKYKNRRKRILHKVYEFFFFFFLVNKAVHIEMVLDLSSEAFIATLKRFIARQENQLRYAVLGQRIEL